jgi:polar amino acid transport system substrate-binding protein
MNDHGSRQHAPGRRLAIAAAAATFCVACGVQPMPASAAPTDLAPTGHLRAAINLGNPVLASKDPATGEARGVSVDLARELSRRLGVPLAIVTYPSAGQVVDALRSGAWDVAFLAIDPARAAEIAFTAPYVVIEGAYLVRRDSAIRNNAEVDRDGVRIAVGKGSAYDLFLTRELKHAAIERAPTSPEVTDFFLARNLDVAAGVKQQLQADAKRVGGVRVLEGNFMVINQAMAMPKGRDAGFVALRDFVEEMKASGFVAAALARHGIEGATVAPPARP